MKQTLYILSGLPFSGKTTLSKKISDYTHSTRISFDELWVELESDVTLELTWKSVLSEAKNKIIENLKKGTSVVYDDTNAKKEHRDFLKNIAQQNLVTFQIIYLDISSNIILKRRKLNVISGERHDVINTNFNSLIEQFEIPTSNEKAIKFKTDENFNEWAELNL